MFAYETWVKLYDTDAAGLLFFGNHFRVMHDAYEAYLTSCGFDIGEIIRTGDLLIPLVHAECDYHHQLNVGDRITVHLTCDKISTHSFVLKANLLRDAETHVATVTTVHVCTDGSGGNKVPIPGNVRDALDGLR
ncbi:MAG: acyl-CoA thioesterase [candidate division Zixibacteria bacterium]|nr:acyl-CoA thioesterase [candidate division Zixibacteria bacterium]